MELITEQTKVGDRFPWPETLQKCLTPEGKETFAHYFVKARDEVENAYYAEIDRNMTPRTRAGRFFRAMFNPLINKPVEGPEELYATFGRLIRRAWLSVSLGIYDQTISSIPNPATRLHVAQVNTVDIAWQPIIHRLSQLSEPGLIIEIGTGRGNSICRLAQLLPKTKIISITISPEQYHIAGRLIKKLGLDNIEVRLGDIFDTTVTQDLIGKADGLAAIEVTGHFPHERKIEGIGILTSLLKPNSPISLLDTIRTPRLSNFMIRYQENQSWFAGSREVFLAAFEKADVTAISCVDYIEDVLQTFLDTTPILRGYRSALKDEFGLLLAALWPEIPGTMHLKTTKDMDYIHVIGIKN